MWTENDTNDAAAIQALAESASAVILQAQAENKIDSAVAGALLGGIGVMPSPGNGTLLEIIRDQRARHQQQQGNGG